MTKLRNRYGNPFRKVRYIPTVDEILKKAFDKAANPKSKYARSRRKSREERIVSLEEARIKALSSEITNNIEKIVNQFPWIDSMHPFYISLCSIFGDVDKIKKILGRLSGIAMSIRKIEKDELLKLKKTKHPQEAASIRRSAGGRFSSLLKKASSDVKYLIKIIKKGKTIPDFNMLLPTVVIAGGPNVGKSSLVRVISSGKPEIGEYPFTTKKVVFGHRDIFFVNVQVVDTPGLLDRPFKERNIIELQSLASLEYIADIIIYMFDYTKKAALSNIEQINLLEDIRNKFTTAPIIKVLNKIDELNTIEINKAKEIFNPDFAISVEKKQGIKPLTDYLDKLILKIWKTSEKFKEVSSFKIDEEYLEDDEENIELDYTL